MSYLQYTRFERKTTLILPVTLNTATPRTAPTHGTTRVADTCHSERASPRASRRIPTGTDARTSRSTPSLLRGTLRLRSLGGCSAQGDVVFVIGSERVRRVSRRVPTRSAWPRSPQLHPEPRDARTTMAKGILEERTRANCGGGRPARMMPIWSQRLNRGFA